MDTEQKPTLTERQTQVLDFIRQNSHLYGPTVREIAAAFGIRSPNGVACHLKALERKGYVTRDTRKARAIKVTE